MVDRILKVSYNHLGSYEEFVIDLTGYLVKSGSSLKAIYGGVSTYNRYISDIQESNPFKKVGGYALNNIEESELVFIESLGCYIRKDYEKYN